MNSRLWVTVAVMAATVMQVLDTTIVNVALPQMQGELVFADTDRLNVRDQIRRAIGRG